MSLEDHPDVLLTSAVFMLLALVAMPVISDGIMAEVDIEVIGILVDGIHGLELPPDVLHDRLSDLVCDLRVGQLGGRKVQREVANPHSAVFAMFGGGLLHGTADV